ncbi:UvrD-helicase domain-containing protein [Luminiphilus sp.]|nr:UvrD-helicase domain-containing protein [Luminiphilus sp.]
MGLQLMLEKGDKALVGDDTILVKKFPDIGRRMTKESILRAEPNLLGRLFGAGGLWLSSQQLEVRKGGRLLKSLDLAELSALPELRSGLFGRKICVQISGKSYVFRMLRTGSGEFDAKVLLNKLQDVFVDQLKNLAKRYEKEAVTSFLRDSKAASLDKVLRPIIDDAHKSENRWSAVVPADLAASFDRIAEHCPLMEHRAAIRKVHEAHALNGNERFFNSVESNPLTTDQRLAVIRDNDKNLVLAAAGTGKTSVIVSKVLYLLKKPEINPEDILVLAYNKAAADELNQRTKARAEAVSKGELKTPACSTFHALGRKILKEAGVSVHLSTFSEDSVSLLMWVTKWVYEYVSANPSNLSNFILLSYQPVNPFDFKTKQEYDSYVRDNEFRTLNGEQVRGYQELLIANWLYLSGIEYEYEAPYVSKRRVEAGIDYRPDFHITGTDIYLEHFGIDRKGNTRADIDKVEYNKKIGLKRKLHIEHGTKLLETFHFDWTEGNLENRLEALISEVGIPVAPVPPELVLETMKNKGFIDAGAKRYHKCLQAIRIEDLKRDDVQKRLEDSQIQYSTQYADLIDQLLSAYRSELEKQQSIDFDDMILRAADVIEQKDFEPKWKHILVDEFQDISAARMRLLKALVNCRAQPTLTAVGDDWQAIYRFAGGKLDLTSRFHEKVGEHSQTKLEKTFRYNSSIAHTAGAFVMRNPEQYEKSVVTDVEAAGPQIYLLDDRSGGSDPLQERALQVANRIRSEDANGKIVILARYNYLLKNARDYFRSNSSIKVDYRTFHGSKGLEWDYCILIGFFQGKSGFPNQNREEALLEALLPATDDFPHSEERRLLYVALTRAKHKSYLIADPMAPSSFITELLSPAYEINIHSATFEEQYRFIFKCPQCSTGYFRLMKGQYGEFYSCTSGRSCRIRPRICQSCGSPSLDTIDTSKCNNVACRAQTPICDRCGRPMKLRDGRFGKFWGCSGYGLRKDRCRNTWKLGRFSPVEDDSHRNRDVKNPRSRH